MEYFQISQLKNPLTVKSLVRVLLVTFLGLMLTACGSGGSEADPGYSSSSSQNPQSSAANATSMDSLQEDPALINTPANVSYETTLANTGMRVGLVGDIDPDTFDFDFLESQWQHMQSCLQITASAPMVYVSAESIRPLTPADDVLYNLDGSLLASSSLTNIGAVIQVRAGDFDGSYGNAGFYFRSVSGRLLWLNEGLAERDYPFSCARSG